MLDDWGTATITNVTFTGNQAAGTAGALCLNHHLQAASFYVCRVTAFISGVAWQGRPGQ